MDSKLQEKGAALDRQREKLRDAEREFLELEAQRKPLWSALFLRADGKTVAEKEALANSHPDWVTFTNAHVEAEVNFHDQLRKYEIFKMACQFEYGSLKYDTDAIKRGIG